MVEEPECVGDDCLTDEDISVGPDNSLALLEAGDVESISETELVPGEEGEMQRCGDFTFPVTVKSEQGHEWLPPEVPGFCPKIGRRHSPVGNSPV